VLQCGLGFDFFLRGERKKQNKFHQICTVLSKAKFFPIFYFVNIVSVCGVVFLHLLPTAGGVASAGARVSISSHDEIAPNGR